MTKRFLLKTGPLSILGVFFFLFSINTTFATTYTFVGGGVNNSWFDNANWSGNVAPTTLTATDAIVINAPCRLPNGISDRYEIPCDMTISSTGSLEYVGAQSQSDPDSLVIMPTCHFTNNGTLTLSNRLSNRSQNFINNGNILLVLGSVGLPGIISNYGTLMNQSTGSITIGTPVNDINLSGIFFNQTGGVVTNNGTIVNNLIWYNLEGSTLNNAGSFTSPNTLGTFALHGVNLQSSPMQLHDFLNGRDAKTRTKAFRSEQGFPNFIQHVVGNAGTVILKVDFNAALCKFCTHVDLRGAASHLNEWLAPVYHGLNSVGQQVDHSTCRAFSIDVCLKAAKT